MQVSELRHLLLALLLLLLHALQVAKACSTQLEAQAAPVHNCRAHGLLLLLVLLMPLLLLLLLLLLSTCWHMTV